MQIIRSISDMQAASRALQREGKRLVLVPTMGFLHEGHLSLMRVAHDNGDIVMVSLFVNPTQFGPNEDFASYPRDEERDAKLCKNEGVDILFMPGADEMYDEHAAVYVDDELLSNTLCGRSRPGHFRGVLTVVAKLFNITQPDAAVFGQKDAQQLALIRKMVADLNFPVEIIGAPTVREADGVAMSSRNSYLSDDERRDAQVLHQALEHVRELHQKGERDAIALRKVLSEQVSATDIARLDYAEIVDAGTLQPIETVNGSALVAVAAHFGKARLIDNVLLG